MLHVIVNENLFKIWIWEGVHPQSATCIEPTCAWLDLEGDKYSLLLCDPHCEGTAYSNE